MASFLDEFEPPMFKERKRKEFSWGTIIILLIIIGLIVYFVNRPSPVSQQAVQETTEESAPSAPSQEPTAEAITSTAPSFGEKCDVVAGIVPGSIKTDAQNIVTVTFKNNGKKTIEGSYFEFTADSKKAYRHNSESLAAGEMITYSIDLDDASKELGLKVNSFVILPVQAGVACYNQRMVVIQ